MTADEQQGLRKAAITTPIVLKDILEEFQREPANWGA